MICFPLSSGPNGGPAGKLIPRGGGITFCAVGTAQKAAPPYDHTASQAFSSTNSGVMSQVQQVALSLPIPRAMSIVISSALMIAAASSAS